MILIKTISTDQHKAKLKHILLNNELFIKYPHVYTVLRTVLPICNAPENPLLTNDEYVEILFKLHRNQKNEIKKIDDQVNF